MKSSAWIIFLAAFWFAAGYFLRNSMPGVVLFFVPIVVLLAVYGSFVYSFRAGLKAQPIPKKGYEKRIKDLESDHKLLEELGFEKKDEFYLKCIPDSIVYMYLHKSEPIIACLYHIEAKKACDFITHFDPNITLTTCETVDGGLVPLPPNRLLQIFENIPRKEFFEKHKEALHFIQEKGRRPYQISQDRLRNEVFDSFKEYSQNVRKRFLWPALLIFWMLTKRGKRHLGSIEEQYKREIVKVL